MPVKALMSQLSHKIGCFTCISVQLFGILTTKPNTPCRGHGEGPHMQMQLMGADPGSAWSSSPWMWHTSAQPVSRLKVKFSRTPAPLKLQPGPILQYPKRVHYPTYLSQGPFQSPLHLRPHCWRVSCSLVTPRTFQKPSMASPNSSNIWVFWKLASSSVWQVLLGFLSLASAQLQQRLSATVKIKSSNNTHQQADT